MVRELAERVANLPPVPEPLLPPARARRARARACGRGAGRESRQAGPGAATGDTAAAPDARASQLPPEPVIGDDEKLLSIEALLKERQRAFIELVTTAETLRMKVARLEEILDERDRELTKLRIARAV